jgi:protein-tyrosine phosphatase
MIDLHSHILPNLDDGPRTMEDSIQMCRISYHDGIRAIVATPHILPGIYKNDRSTILTKLHELNDALVQSAICHPQSAKSLDSAISTLRSRATTEGGRIPKSEIDVNSELRTPNSKLPLRVLPGADVHFSSDILQRYEKGEIVTVNDRGRYLMVEFAFQGIPYQAEEVLFQLLTKGIIPIISHPERNMEIGQRPQRYYEMIRMGCLGQVTAMSLTGEFGSGVRRIAEKLLSKRLLHIIASDAHSIDRRPPILSAAVGVAEKMVGKEEAYKMVTDYPQAVLDGKKPNVPEPLSP